MARDPSLYTLRLFLRAVFLCLFAGQALPTCVVSRLCFQGSLWRKQTPIYESEESGKTFPHDCTPPHGLNGILLSSVYLPKWILQGTLLKKTTMPSRHKQPQAYAFIQFLPEQVSYKQLLLKINQSTSPLLHGHGSYFSLSPNLWLVALLVCKANPASSLNNTASIGQCARLCFSSKNFIIHLGD